MIIDYPPKLHEYIEKQVRAIGLRHPILLMPFGTVTLHDMPLHQAVRFARRAIDARQQLLAPIPSGVSSRTVAERRLRQTDRRA